MTPQTRMAAFCFAITIIVIVSAFAVQLFATLAYCAHVLEKAAQ